ncbi:cell division protein FtsZ [Paenibacillus thiaminolyticus]|uniref:Cell division protein FtsZ n=1 Tax=Paenibacillus thiaminolyticus TaxID=49283 RepID=A0A3A3GCY4_PANTH|nr:cell division protein FtsZ [Paenibacillus thiaminolyticus]RJG21335.1 cell division protein FtsZ [Paenibacillus thiaminolyticus]
MSSTNHEPSIDMTLVGLGQAGDRIIDCFASYFTPDGKPVYNTLALNSNDGDLAELKNVPMENRFSLKLGGLGKNPEKAMSILEDNESAKELLKEFVTKRIRVKDKMVVFVAGLGGGTGTATLVKAIEEFHEYHNMKYVKEELKKIIQQIGPAEYKANSNKYKTLAFREAENKFIKIGVIACLPVRSDGPDVLRQVNNFANRIWTAAKNPTKGISFVWFPDNQMFYDRFKEERGKLSNIENYRDFANIEIADIIHQLNIGTNAGGTSVVYDSHDFRRTISEHNGCLVLNKLEVPSKTISSSTDLNKLLVKSIQENRFHDPIQLIETNESGESLYSKVYHVGMLAIIPPELNSFGSSFIDDAKDEISQQLRIQGTIFSGYLIRKNNYNVTAYTIYKTDALPSRLSRGLVEEYTEFMEKQKETQFKESGAIQQIAATNEDYLDFELDEMDLGIELDDITNDDELGDINIDDELLNIDPNKM